MATQLRFDDHVVIVTGGGRGIGRAHSRFLASRGARVVVNDLGGDGAGMGASSQPAEEVAAEIRAAGGEATPNFDTVSTPEGAQSIVDTAISVYGRVDALIHNAGIADLHPFLEEGIDLFTRTRASHLDGGYYLCRAVWPRMQERHYGRIVLTGSCCGMFGHPENVAYSTAKAGLMGMMRALAAAGEPDGIKVNLLAVGAYTRLTGSMFQEADPSPEQRATEEFFNRFLQPDMVSPAAAYLIHPSCEANGEMWEAQGGAVRQYVMSITPGYLNFALTPEDIRDNLAQISDRKGQAEFASVHSFAVEMMDRLRTAAGAPAGPAITPSKLLR